jgi:hypothetical protein
MDEEAGDEGGTTAKTNGRAILQELRSLLQEECPASVKAYMQPE